MSFSASNALALRPSITTVIVTDSAMAKKMPTHSRMSAWPPAMARVMLTPRVMAAAIISMMSIGSAAVLTMRESIDSGFGLVKALRTVLVQVVRGLFAGQALMCIGAQRADDCWRILHEWCGRLPVGRGHMFLSFG